MISFLSVYASWLVVYGIGDPVRWALLIPGAVLVAAFAALAVLPMRAGIAVTPEHILIRTATGRTTRVPWAQVTGFKAVKGPGKSPDEDTVLVLTSGGGRLHTLGYGTAGTSPTEIWQLLRVLEDERLARAPGTASTLPPRPSPRPGEDGVRSVWTGICVIMLMIFGSLTLYFAVTGLGPALRAARGEGTAGYFIPQRETTGKGATWYGEFRLPDGTVTRRNVSIEDLPVSGMQAGVPVAARDTGDPEGIFPRKDPGAWHLPANLAVMAGWSYGWVLVVIIRKGIRLRRGRRHGNSPAPPQAAGLRNLRLRMYPNPPAPHWFRIPEPGDLCTSIAPPATNRDRCIIGDRHARCRVGRRDALTFGDSSHRGPAGAYASRPQAVDAGRRSDRHAVSRRQHGMLAGLHSECRHATARPLCATTGRAGCADGPALWLGPARCPQAQPV
jgi:hypothetical protein